MTHKTGSTGNMTTAELISKLNTATKSKKGRIKRLSKSERIHIRRLKAEARKEGVMYQSKIQ